MGCHFRKLFVYTYFIFPRPVNGCGSFIRVGLGNFAYNGIAGHHRPLVPKNLSKAYTLPVVPDRLNRVCGGDQIARVRGLEIGAQTSVS